MRRFDAAALFAVLSAIFWAGRSRSFGPGDSPQHALAAALFIVPHPPGYPLQSFLARLLGDANFLSGLCHAGAAAVLFLLLRRAKVRPLAALTAALLMALSPLFWYYSLVAEVRALNDLLALGAALFAADWARSGKDRSLLLFSVLFGLGLSHHPSFVFLVPAYAVWLTARRPKNALASKAGALAAAALAAPYVLLGLRLAHGAPAYNLFEVNGWGDLPGLFLRSGLGGPLRLAGSGAPGFAFARLAEQAGWFASSLWMNLGPAGLFLSAAGVWALRRDNERRELAAWGLWAIAAISLYLAFSSAQLPAVEAEYARAVATRFHLLPLIAAFALAGYGAHALTSRLPAGSAVLLLAAAVLGPALLHPMTMAGRDPLRDYARGLIRDSAPGDLIVLGGDDTIFAALNLELVTKEAGGRVFLCPTMFGFPPYQRRLARVYPGLVLPSPLTTDWAAWKKLNPGRDVLAEASVLEPVLHDFPLSVPQGSLVRVETSKARSEPAVEARRFLEAPETAALTRARAYPWTQEVYVLQARRRMAAWLASRLDPAKDADLRARLALLVERL